MQKAWTKVIQASGVEALGISQYGDKFPGALELCGHRDVNAVYSAD